MKRKLVASIFGIAAAGAGFISGNVTNAQGLIYLDSYNTSPSSPYPLVTYGFASGGTLGAGVMASSGFTVGFYYSTSPLNAVATTSQNFDHTIPGGTLATGAGSTAAFNSNIPGLFTAVGDQYFSTGLPAGPIYIIVVAYNGATYDTSPIRGHSHSFMLTSSAAPPIPGMGGSPGLMGAFEVTVLTPEPSTFALTGLGLGSLLIFRRRK